jgi:hypothetical protein
MPPPRPRPGAGQAGPDGGDAGRRAQTAETRGGETALWTRNAPATSPRSPCRRLLARAIMRFSSPPPPPACLLHRARCPPQSLKRGSAKPQAGQSLKRGCRPILMEPPVRALRYEPRPGASYAAAPAVGGANHAPAAGGTSHAPCWTESCCHLPPHPCVSPPTAPRQRGPFCRPPGAATGAKFWNSTVFSKPTCIASTPQDASNGLTAGSGGSTQGRGARSRRGPGARPPEEAAHRRVLDAGRRRARQRPRAGGGRPLGLQARARAAAAVAARRRHERGHERRGQGGRGRLAPLPVL